MLAASLGKPGWCNGEPGRRQCRHYLSPVLPSLLTALPAWLHSFPVYPLQEFVRLATAMTAGKATPAGPPPPNQLSKQWSLVPPVVADGVPAGKVFGDVAEDVLPGSFAVGDTVVAVFHAGCPRNNIRAEGTFLAGGWAAGGREAWWDGARETYGGGDAVQGSSVQWRYSLG